ncbi:MAG: hypothetical protein AB7E95_12125 [Kiritimatiellales bacterium]
MRQTAAVLITVICGVLAGRADFSGSSGDASAWFADPTLWTFCQGSARCTQPKGQGSAVYQSAPKSSEVTVEAVLTPSSAEDSGWNTAAVAIVDDEDNFWQLALLEEPDQSGRVHRIQLAEMHHGNWMAQNRLRVDFAEPASAPWTFNQRYRLCLSMDREGVTGTVVDSMGKRLFYQRFVFTTATVRCGRPALRVVKMIGEFTDIRVSSGDPAAQDAKIYPEYSSRCFVPSVKEKATGFFHVVQKNGTWWTIDPLGRGFVPLGVDHVKFWGPWCEKLGYCPYGRSNESKYSTREQWEAETLQRLKDWGFNMLGAGSAPELYHRGLGHTINLEIGTDLGLRGDEYTITANEFRPGSAFPNVFHPDFEAFCRYRAEQRCSARNDPWLFGYFIDNELAWWGRNEKDRAVGLFDAVMSKGPDHSAKKALVVFLKKQVSGNLREFNRLWNTQLSDFDDLLSRQELPTQTDAQRSVKREFLRRIAERYFSVTSQAIREADPNHMVLGSRFAGTGSADSVVWEAAGKYCDVLTFNCYPTARLDENCVRYGKDGESAAEHFERYYNYARRPLLITEWSFPALDSGLPCTHGAGQRFRTQAERTAAAELFARTILGLPFLLGYNWFMWVDEPALGISKAFPENSNYGLVNEDGEPYEQLTGMFRDFHRTTGDCRMNLLLPEKRETVSEPAADALSIALRSGSTGDRSSSVFTQDGDAFRLENGRLILEGSCGSDRILQQVRFAGRPDPVGSYNAMIQTVNARGQHQWTEMQTVQSVDTKKIRGLTVVEITGTASGAVSFEMTQRLILPSGRNWFLAEAVKLKNTGRQPMRLKGLLFRFYSRFNRQPTLLPRLWGMPPSSCWMDDRNDLFFGAVAAKNSGIQVRFWKDQNGGAHPDAKFETGGIVLQPGALYVPDRPVNLIAVAGSAHEQSWIETAFHLAQFFGPDETD